MQRALIAAALVLEVLLGCSSEHAPPHAAASSPEGAQPPQLDSSQATPPGETAASQLLDTASIRLERIEYQVLYRSGDTSADLVAHPGADTTSVTRDPPASTVARVVVSGPPETTPHDVLLNLVPGRRGAPRQTPLGTFDPTGHQVYSYPLPAPPGCDSVVLNAYLQRGLMLFAGRRVTVVFDFGCE